ncbi:twin-arginine translocation signal domain-containing protein [Nitratireductor aquimarinus]|uniref:twin-arginine translocation signal domain-containing protein n=1 Tax=Nitratireductor TaxID=245876 RepID=UPI0019D40F06|nr:MULTISPECIES: twin-arginine translocation signal domain-containing protein [Nitratireductor]MBN7777763.1 twin-arginine translocation signal domain-containing protein [Nitratireductor pacificus]MBN7781757.1 twin-arginine translocation signal domain-containing protein [Nitratireductor pacificus]MBN7790563.1 twin-arginine translocation signal domain-containing protein [Nitratireductor aquimarinus]MBY6099973.1 twin-arginine translocation signal domain-containing protein [Nitratireductor aquimari
MKRRSFLRFLGAAPLAGVAAVAAMPEPTQARTIKWPEGIKLIKFDAKDVHIWSEEVEAALLKDIDARVDRRIAAREVRRVRL